MIVDSLSKRRWVGNSPSLRLRHRWLKSPHEDMGIPRCFQRITVSDYRCHIVNITTFFLIFSFCLFFAWVCLPNLFGMILKAFPSPSTSHAPLTRSVPLGSCGYREALTPRDQECWWVAGTSRPIPQAKSPRPWMGNLKNLWSFDHEIGRFFQWSMEMFRKVETSRMSIFFFMIPYGWTLRDV